VNIQLKSNQISHLVFTPNIGTPQINDIADSGTEIATEVFYEETTQEVILTATNNEDIQLGNAYTKSSM